MVVGTINSVETQQWVTSISGFQQVQAPKSSTADIQNAATITALVGGAVVSVGNVLVTPSSGSGDTETGSQDPQGGSGLAFMLTTVLGDSAKTGLDQQDIAQQKADEQALINSLADRMRTCSTGGELAKLLSQIKDEYSDPSLGSGVADQVRSLTTTGDRLVDLWNGYQSDLQRIGLNVQWLDSNPITSGASNFFGIGTGHDKAAEIARLASDASVKAGQMREIMQSLPGQTSTEAGKLGKESEGTLQGYNGDIQRLASVVSTLTGGGI